MCKCYSRTLGYLHTVGRCQHHHSHTSPPPPPHTPHSCCRPPTIISRSGFFYEGTSPDGQARPWFLTFTFAVACVTIASGCLAERTRLLVYPCYTLLLSGVLHPLIVHWVWANDSWLNRLTRCSVLDFAGGFTVHALGACVRGGHTLVYVYPCTLSLHTPPMHCCCYVCASLRRWSVWYCWRRACGPTPWTF